MALVRKYWVPVFDNGHNIVKYIMRQEYDSGVSEQAVPDSDVDKESTDQWRKLRLFRDQYGMYLNQFQLTWLDQLIRKMNQCNPSLLMTSQEMQEVNAMYSAVRHRRSSTIP